MGRTPCGRGVWKDSHGERILIAADERLGEPAAAIAGDARNSVAWKRKVAEAFRLAKAGGLVILTKRDGYRVFRATAPRLTFIGERVDVGSLLALVKRSTPSKAGDQ